MKKKTQSLPKTHYEVLVAFIYEDEELGCWRETSMDIIYLATEKTAMLAGIKWAVNRRNALSTIGEKFKKVACIKIYPYTIGEPEPTGYIKTGTFGLGMVMEWKYDTSHYRTVDELLTAAEANELRVGRN